VVPSRHHSSKPTRLFHWIRPRHVLQGGWIPLAGPGLAPPPQTRPQHFHLNLITIKPLLRSTAPPHAGEVSVRTRLSHIQTEEFSALFVVLSNSGTLLRYIQLTTTYVQIMLKKKNATLSSCFICFVCLLRSCVLCYVLFIHHCKPNLLLSFHAAWKKRK
jgi:hypothetical protein